MRINEQTKIAVLLKHHPDALEAIVALADDFKKLRNPVLRKLMAGRTSIVMAAKIGGCTPQDFFNTLVPLGFEIAEAANEEVKTKQNPVPDFLKKLESNQLISLDVRSMLAEGTDPLKLIQQTVREMHPGQVLQIINTFEPVPLIKLLEKQGFEAWVDVVEQDLIETFFFKKGAQQPAQVKPESSDTDSWEALLQQYTGKLETIDVRHLEMPGPMMAILDALERLPAEKALYVQHKRIPVFLLTELKDRNFDYRIKEVADGEVYLLIFKK